MSQILKFPQESHGEERKRKKSGAGSRRKLLPRKRFHRVLATYHMTILQGTLEPGDVDG